MSFYDDASWLLIPSGIKEDVVYAQKPTSGLGDLTFTRASDATYTDSTGVVRRSPYNLLQQSEMFSNVIWSKINATIGIDATVAPNGTLTADKLIENTVNDQHRTDQTSTSQLGPNTFSVYAKKAERDFIQLRIGLAGASFDLTNGIVGGVGGGITASILDAGNGWYRCIITRTSTVTNEVVRINLATGIGGTNYAGDGTSGVFIWGAQLVEGTSALDYFPTTNRQDVPRIDFRNADGTLSSCGRLLLEPQRTNLLTYSEQFDNAAWTKQNTSVTANSATSPDGYQNADLIVPANGVDGIVFFSGLSFTSGTTYTLSVFGKKEDFDFLLLAFPSSAFPSSNRVALFDLNNGTIASATQSGTGAIITDYGNGWYRCSISIAATTTITGNIVYGARSSNNLTSLGNGTDGVYIYGAQLEAGAYPTTYIPTTTAAVTRIADVARKTGVSSLIGQTQGTLFAEVNLSAITAERRIISITEGSELQRIMIWTMGTTLYVNFNGSTVTLGNFPNGSLKIAVGYTISGGNTTYSITTNGGAVTTGTFAVSPTGLSQINLGSNAAGGLPLSDRATQSALFPTRLSNSQLQSLTTL